MSQGYQSGITLVVVLVILVAMTFLGLGAMSDSNLQLSMVRNAQLQNRAHNAALSEVNAQIDFINENNPGETDPTILAVINDPSSEIDLLGTNLFLPGILNGGNVTQQLTLREIGVGVPQNFSFNGPVVSRNLEFESNVTIPGTCLLYTSPSPRDS